MFKYIIKRILIGFLTLFILASITFALMHAIPGEPFSQDNKKMSPETFAALEAKYGLDKSIPEQYVIYMSNALKFEFGESIAKEGQEVIDIIMNKAPLTAKVGSLAFIVAIIVGVTLGVISALTKKKWLNNIITIIVTAGVSVPSFIIAIFLLVVLGVKLKLLPTMGLTSPLHYILPVSALALSPISMITRLTRSSLRDVMNKDYITLARSKGTSEIKVIVKHGLKNALLPVVTYCGPLFAGLVTGSFVVERLFNIRGIGEEFVSCVTNRDYPMIMGLTCFLGAIVIVMNILSDIVAAMIDPRIRIKG